MLSIKYRAAHHRYPAPTDFEELCALSQNLLASNNLEPSFLSQDDIGTICRQSWGMLAPVCSVIGGFLSQEIVKSVSKIGIPMTNVLVFNAKDNIARSFTAGIN
jgi:hypothetical protein